MKKLIKLTEKDLHKIVKRVIKENSSFRPIDGSGKMNNVVGNLHRKIYQKKNGEKVIKYFFVGETPGGGGFPPSPNIPKLYKIVLCGVPDNLAHLINNPNGLVSIQWAGMGTPGGSKPNDPCTSPIELQMKEHIQPEKEEVDDWWNNEITD